MSALQDFLEKLNQGKETHVPFAQSFPELDLDKIRKDLNLVKEGRERGAKNLPPPAGDALDDIEHKITAAIEAEHRRRQQSLANQLNACHQRTASLDVENEAINIAGAAQRASTEFTVKVDEGKAKLFTLWRNVCMIENQWNDFRKHHRLIHPADYPLSRLWSFTVILVILAIESILNGNFLARGLETGLIGGIVEAFVIAATNVSFGYFLGDCVVRYLFHRSYTLRALAFIEIPVSVGIAVFFNLLVGHYRDALNGPDPVHASAIAFDSLSLHPFVLASLQSWMLFAMGLFFCTVAGLDGFKMDDPYPGYGKINRKHEEITQEYMNEKANIIDDLNRTRDQALDSIQEARQNLAARRAELAGIMDYREKLIHLSEAHRDYLNRAANDLLSVYRHANMQARTLPPPGHFSESYSLPQSSSPSPPPAANATVLEVNIEKTDAALRAAIGQVNGRFEEAVGSFHQVGEFASGDSHAASAAAP